MAQSNKLARNVIANYLGQGWTAIMAIAFVPIYIDHLGMEAYGLIGFFSVMQSLLTVFDLGITSTLTREMARYATGMHTTRSIRDLLRTFEWICYPLSMVIALSVWVLGPWLASEWIKADRLPPEAVVHSVVMMAVVFAARFLEGIYRGALIGLERQVLYNGVTSAMATARYAGAVLVLQYPSATIETFFAWQAVMSMLSLAVLVVSVGRSLPRSDRNPRFSGELLRSVLRFSAGMTAVSGLSMAMISIDKLMLSTLLPLDQFGHYALASVAASVLYMVVVPITQAAYPGMVGQIARADSAAVTQIYHGTSQMVVAVVGPAALCLSFFSVEIIYVWSGNLALAESTAPILTLLALAAFANCLGHLAYNLQLAHGRTKVLITANVGAILLAIAILPWAAADYGVIGAGYAWLTVGCTHAIATIYISHKRLIPSAGWRWLVQDIAPPLVAALSTVMLAYWFRPGLFLGRVEWGLFLLMVGLASLGAAALLTPRVRYALKISS